MEVVTESEMPTGDADSERELIPEVLEESVLEDFSRPKLWVLTGNGTGFRSVVASILFDVSATVRIGSCWGSVIAVVVGWVAKEVANCG